MSNPVQEAKEKVLVELCDYIHTLPHAEQLMACHLCFNAQEGNASNYYAQGVKEELMVKIQEIISTTNLYLDSGTFIIVKDIFPGV